MVGRRNLFVPDKMAYAKGARPPVECILCAVVERHAEVTNLEVARLEGFVMSANLYPYNPGHLMIFPERHMLDPREFATDEAATLHRLTGVAMDCLGGLYGAQGFNVGFNYGLVSGASIEHFHLHVVPRYAREIGFVDIVGGARIIVEDPNETCRKVAADLRRRLTRRTPRKVRRTP